MQSRPVIAFSASVLTGGGAVRRRRSQVNANPNSNSKNPWRVGD